MYFDHKQGHVPFMPDRETGAHAARRMRRARASDQHSEQVPGTSKRAGMSRSRQHVTVSQASAPGDLFQGSGEQDPGTVACPRCHGSELVYLGELGCLVYVRCRACHWDFSV